MVGVGWDSLAREATLHGMAREGTDGRASKHVNADKHLMLEKTQFGDFES